MRPVQYHTASGSEHQSLPIQVRVEPPLEALTQKHHMVPRPLWVLDEECGSLKNNCTRPLEPSKCGPFPFMSSSLEELGKVLLKKMSWVIILRVHRGNRWLRTNDLDKHNLASSEVPQQGLQVTLWTQRGLGLIESCQLWGALSRPCINSETHGHRPTPHPSRCRN